MISFKIIDIAIIIGYLLFVILIGFLASKGSNKNNDDYLLSGRKVGMFLFILTNVATWYGGILGVGEFSYLYGIVSWITQGFPYYIFALIFAFVLAGKIRSASLFTIPDKLEEVYGKKISLISAILIFVLVSPAPYILILSQILSLIFEIDYIYSLLLSSIVSSIYLIKGGYKSNIWTDSLSFFTMFIGFIIIVYTATSTYGNYEFLIENLPASHLSVSGGNSFTFIIVWFLIALWTFTDPGFHQRCYSAKSGSVAKWGIVFSIILWFIFDFLTNTTGLYARAILPNLDNPVLSFPYLAEEILSPGLKGIFFAALIATVLSTLNSFLFLSATTFSKDFIFRVKDSNKIKYDLIQTTKFGIIITLIISLIIASYFQSVIGLWYTIGSICIPGLILLVISSYYPKIQINKRIALIEITVGVFSSIIWLFIRKFISTSSTIYQIEPMIVGLVFVIIIHFYGIKKKTSNIIIQ